MKVTIHTCLLSLGLLTAPLAAKTPSDLVPAELRRNTVNTAERLVRPIEPASVTVLAVNPFDPLGFDESSPTDAQARRDRTAAATKPALPATSRDLLDSIAARLSSPGKVVRGAVTYLSFPQGVLQAGDTLVFEIDGRRVPVEISAVDRATFTLRLDDAEVTRPIAAPGAR